MQNKEMLRALVGLARAVDAEKTPTVDTEDVLRAGLAAIDTDELELLARVKAEKTRVCPDCATCPHPCGRTADPEGYELDSHADIKEKILIALQLGVDFDGMVEGLCALGLDTSEGWLSGVLERLGGNSL